MDHINSHRHAYFTWIKLLIHHRQPSDLSAQRPGGITINENFLTFANIITDIGSADSSISQFFFFTSKNLTKAKNHFAKQRYYIKLDK